KIMHLDSIFILILAHSCVQSTRLPLEVFQRHPTEHHHHHRTTNFNLGGNFHRKKIIEYTTLKILYQIGESEEDLPQCNTRSICNKVDLYDTPGSKGSVDVPKEVAQWNLRLMMDTHLRKKLDSTNCVNLLKTYPNAGNIKTTFKLKKSDYSFFFRYFQDATWSITLYPNNVTDQVVHCHCPKNSITYLNKRNVIKLPNEEVAFQYLFFCSPQTRLRCQRKEPCRLFTVRKRQEFLDEVNVSTLCQCPRAHRCPHHHTDYGVVSGKTYSEEAIKTYSGYCLPS
ncbi:hypothetical protein NQ317_019209, partial [Molorchus minor]